jgi:hypothetical protein
VHEAQARDNQNQPPHANEGMPQNPKYYMVQSVHIPLIDCSICTKNLLCIESQGASLSVTRCQIKNMRKHSAGGTKLLKEN